MKAKTPVQRSDMSEKRGRKLDIELPALEPLDLTTTCDSDSSSRTLDVAIPCDDCMVDQEAQVVRKKERWKPSPQMIRDAIIGLSDGLTVPFALTAGLSSLGDTRVVVLGGFAELIAGAISMGLGGFIGAKSEKESYIAVVNETRRLMRTSPCKTNSMIAASFKNYGFPARYLSEMSSILHESPENLLDFLMRYHHQMPEPATSRPFVSAATIALGYFLGGFVPLLPYICVSRDQVLTGLWISIGVMVFALFVFGWVKTAVVSGWRGRQNIQQSLKGAVQMVIVGSVAAGAAVGLVRAINQNQGV
ncbi:MAG: hypothetical protein MMC33_007712 [Icmadophila ericetorum]|nr:hypothetical protein [Icmadophila ericetorum]